MHFSGIACVIISLLDTVITIQGMSSSTSCAVVGLSDKSTIIEGTRSSGTVCAVISLFSTVTTIQEMLSSTACPVVSLVDRVYKYPRDASFWHHSGNHQSSGYNCNFPRDAVLRVLFA